MKKQKKSKIRVIVFDIGGVLALPHHYIKKGEKEFSGIHEHIAQELRISFDEWFDAIDVLYAHATIGKISRKKFVNEVSKKLSVSKKKLAGTIHHVYTSRMKKNNELYTLIKKLRKNGYKVGVLTDQWHFSCESIFPKKEQKNFDFVIVSYEVGMKKPDPAIYHLLMKKIHQKNKTVKPSEVVFIDNRGYNLEPAKKMGIKTVLFRSNADVYQMLKRFDIDHTA